MNQCRTEGIELTPEEVQRLKELPDAAHEVEAHLLCELEDGHAGPHWALAQTEDRGEETKQWWLRWDDEAREWQHDPDCPAEDPSGADWCLLPTGHQGAHSWA
ncbi:hypothetical protein [Streptomyces sp. PU_AKi4]|uniref:hypothetical protein n=1 Tax=Streptomyces sp. PU_AKi4 TaxID=2800809 RepID=UPI00352488C5